MRIAAFCPATHARAALQTPKPRILRSQPAMGNQTHSVRGRTAFAAETSTQESAMLLACSQRYLYLGATGAIIFSSVPGAAEPNATYPTLRCDLPRFVQHSFLR